MKRNPAIKNQFGIMALLLAMAGMGVAAVALMEGLPGLKGGSGLSPDQFYLAMTGVILFLSGLLPFLSATSRRYWILLLLVAGAFSVALCADLFVFQGEIPGIGAIAGSQYKLILLSSVALGFCLTRTGEWVHNGNSLLGNFRAIPKINITLLARFISVALQLGFLILVIRDFELGNVVFYDSILELIFFGFILHSLLLDEYHLPFFLFLSVAAFIGVLGISNSFWLFGIGFGLIALSHLPVRYWIRITLILVFGILLGVARGGLVQTAVPTAVWPILGSIFMFRLIIYLYDLKHTKKPFDPWSSLSYFFLLPNVVFPFFPVIDFKTFTRTYFNEERQRVYQTGVEWILRGVVQLLVYRIVYYYFTISPEDVTNTAQLIRYTITTFTLYLRVSGEFHIIVGLLHLFGFNLPLTNDNYLLSSSFTDLWRRVNIYWKDFMQKIFYYPSYYWLKKRKISVTAALVFTTIIVFAATWLLHSYQWFWLRGSFLFSANDVLFWTILAVLMIRSTLIDWKRSSARTLGINTMGPREIVARAIRNTATVSLLFFLWTLWTSPSIENWISLWSIAANLKGILTLALALSAAFLFFIGLNWVYRDVLSRGIGNPVNSRKNFSQSMVVNYAIIIAVFLMVNPAVFNRLGKGAQQILTDLSTSHLNEVDEKLLQRGYYEDLMGVNRFNVELWDIYSKRQTDWPMLQDTEAARYSDDPVRIFELNSSVSINFHNAQLSTNQWGMRDQKYELTAAPGTYRIAILGPSFVMGSGVSDDEVFEAVLEKRLNSEFGGKKYAKYEILNFGVAGYTALQELYQLEVDVSQFEPNAVIWVGHHLEMQNIIRYLANRISLGYQTPFNFINEITAKAGVKRGMPEEEIGRLLRPYGMELVTSTYNRIVEDAHEKNFTLIWIYLPVFVGQDSEQIKTDLMGTANAEGFITVDLSDVYDGQDLDSITVAEWDRHPNGQGNQLIARGLYQALVSNEDLAANLGLVQSWSPPQK